MLQSINLIKIVGHAADIATLVSTPLVIIPLVIFWFWNHWRGDMQTKYKVLLVASMLLGAAGYAIDMADRFSLIPHETHLRLRYTADGAEPEALRQDNIFKVYSFQFADNGDDARDPKTTKWTILVIVFDKPLSSEVLHARIFFEGGSLRYEAKKSTSRSIQIRFDGSMGDRVLDIEIQP